jgi:hypothetical protein
VTIENESQAVTLRALIERINRKLRHDSRALHTCREGHTWRRHNMGRYFIVDAGNLPLCRDVDPEKLGRELGVLTELERVA